MFEDEFSQLFSPHVTVLYRLAYQWTLDSNDAEDLVQELALKVVGQIEKIKEIEQVRPWLIKVMYRIFVDLYRRKKNNPVIYNEALVDENDTPPSTSSNQSNDTANVTHTENLKSALIHELKTIEPNRAIALFLFEVEGYSIAEIAELQDVSEGTIKSRLFRAKQTLRKSVSLGTFWDTRS